MINHLKYDMIDKRAIVNIYKKSRVYRVLKTVEHEYNRWKHTHYSGNFCNRSNNSKYLCIVLAGYKDYLYPEVFSRLERYLMPGMDVCVITSGKYCDTVSSLCRENNWSYLSTMENNVCLVQNIAMKLHPEARFIFKLDEDIFITEHYFENMLRALEHAKQGNYSPGVLAPLIPLNAYGYIRVLDKVGKLAEYEKRFGKPLHMHGWKRKIEGDPEVAKFMWRELAIDRLNAEFSKQPLVETPCAIRFSIGAILFERDFYEKMGFFPVNRKKTNMGDDETHIGHFCLAVSRPLMVSENVLVGHFSFGSQNQEMKEFFLANKQFFQSRY